MCLFRKKKKEPAVPPSDIEGMLRAVSVACAQPGAFSTVLSQVYYNARAERYVVKFECLNLASTPGSAKVHYQLRRVERLSGEDLPGLLKYALEYASSPTAFMVPPQTPRGILFGGSSKNK